MNRDLWVYEGDFASLPEATQQRTILLVFLTVGGNCPPPETAHDCPIFVTRKIGCVRRVSVVRSGVRMEFDPRDYDARDNERDRARSGWRSRSTLSAFAVLASGVSRGELAWRITMT